MTINRSRQARRLPLSFLNVNATQSATPTKNTAIPDANLSLNEMLRVMDVAREMRDNREMAERVLARDEARTALREKLLRSAQISGDQVTDAEIDVAIDTYFADRHRYQDPKFSFKVLVAHVWVRRTLLSSIVAASILVMCIIWALCFAPFAPLSPSVKAQRQAVARQTDAQQLADQIAAASLEPEPIARAERLVAEVKAAGRDDPATAMAALESLRQLHQELLETYTLRIASDQDGANLVERSFMEGSSMVSGYYVLVEAVDSNGNVLPRKIRNAEAAQDETVRIWGERIPFEVFERLSIDKESDRIMDESEFGVKERGRSKLSVTMIGPNEQPLNRSTQITKW